MEKEIMRKKMLSLTLLLTTGFIVLLLVGSVHAPPVITQLTNNTAADAHPSISGDGSKIAFWSDVDGDYEIFLWQAEETHATIESCDSTGTKKDTFDIPEEVYVVGNGYPVNFGPHPYDLYVVEDVATWTDGMAIPSRVSGTATSVSSDGSGNIPATLVWNGPLVPGKYDIVVDVDGDGVYDAGIDALDDNDIEVTAGFFVVPEVPLGTIMTSAAMIIALVAYVAVPKWRRKQTYATP